MKMLLMSVLLLFVSQHASAVEVYEGVESVVLPCQVPADVSRNSTAVWDQDDFKVPTVHVRDPSGDDLSDQNDRYLSRTSMFADALQTGDLSLTLRKPTVSDSGTYTCITRRFGQDLKKVYVQLKVTEPPPVWPKVLPAVLVPLIILAAAIGLCVCCAYKRMKDREVAQPEKVTVTQGEEPVVLPFKTTADLPRDVTVEWRLTEPKHMKVHVYESGNNQPDKQDQDYRGRTEMNKDPLRTKDLSLTLKDLHLTDSGVYTCTIYNKDGHMLLQKVVILSVRVPQPEEVTVTQGEESVVLPFKTTADLPHNVTVVWRLTEPKPMKVHVYESGNNQLDEQDQGYRGRTEMDEDPLTAKDLSLTLKYSCPTDSGVYTCTVYNKDGHMLLQKVVILSVRVPQPEEVTVTQGEESVVLPFKTTADLPHNVTVVWRLTEPKPMKVHVYESGNNQLDEQDQGYRGRTEMDEDPLTAKDLSLTLKYSCPTDSGVYTCTVYNKDGHMLLQKVVILRVTVPQPEEVTVTQGEESVVLPFKTTADLPHNVTVVWRLTEPKPMKVHVYESGNNQLDEQDQGYRGRTEMDEDPLTAKDLSLTLKYSCPTDSGVYTCTVYNKDGHMLLQKVVILRVTVSEIEKQEGQESVILPFKTTADLPRDVTVEWTHFNNMKVHVYESGNNQLDEQDQGYRGRTEMNDDPLRTKDLSLTLTYLYHCDNGVYTCTVYNKDRHMLLQKVVILHVRALLRESVCGTEGEKSVILPFKTTATLHLDFTVEWTRSDSNHMKVHVYESGNNQPGKQDQGYRGRTEMDENPLRTKDLSLTLKDLHLTDSGIYTCTVYNKDRRMLLQKVVILYVRVTQKEKVEKLNVTQEEKSVLLPFKTTADLPRDVTVKWRDSNNMKVHVYESGNNQPGKQDQGYISRTEMDEDALRTGDFSLTLKDLRLTDSGVYTCTVYNKDGHMLLQKSVTLSVRVSQPEKVEVTDGDSSVVLPFKTTADLPRDVTVEWRDSNNMKVHVYESGNNQPDKQDQGYRGRTEMNEDPLTAKDLSLTLKYALVTDSGVYTCTVYNKDRRMLLQKSVTLSVKDAKHQMVVTQGLKFVMLPFKIPHDLPQGTTVKWRHNNVTVYRCIHVNVDPWHQINRCGTEMNKDALKTGDLSLTLNDPHLTDSGVYTCTVYNKDRRMLLQKVVRLIVRDNEVDMVEVTQAKESVLLPFKITADLPQDVKVEWTRSDSKHTKVYVFQKSQSQAEEQDQGYRGRAEMNKDPRRTGDLSLTLKDLHLTDSGVYTCTVYNQDGDMLLQKSVTLRVRATLKGAMADMLVCLRRRKAPKQLRNMNHEEERLTAEETV